MRSPPVYVFAEALTYSGAAGLALPIPTLPLPSITNRSFVPTTVEDEILNLPPSAKSEPIAQLFRKLPRPATVDEPCRRSCGDVAAVEPALYIVRSWWTVLL